MTQTLEKSHILVVDDDDRLRDLLQQYLSDQGFVVTPARDAKDARRKMEVFTFDAMILDVMMPQETGFEFLRAVQGQKLPPVLMLTAMGEGADRVEGLEAGAQDYLVKPFEPRELVLRIRNMLRAAQAASGARKTAFFGEFEFDLASGKLLQKGAPVYLTTAESQCLKILAANAGQTISREGLVEAATTDGKASERSVDVQINRLRKKIEPTPGRPIYIQTIRHAGYVLYAEVR